MQMFAEWVKRCLVLLDKTCHWQVYLGIKESWDLLREKCWKRIRALISSHFILLKCNWWEEAFSPWSCVILVSRVGRHQYPNPFPEPLSQWADSGCVYFFGSFYELFKLFSFWSSWMDGGLPGHGGCHQYLSLSPQTFQCAQPLSSCRVYNVRLNSAPLIFPQNSELLC